MDRANTNSVLCGLRAMRRSVRSATQERRPCASPRSRGLGLSLLHIMVLWPRHLFSSSPLSPSTPLRCLHSLFLLLSIPSQERRAVLTGGLSPPFCCTSWYCGHVTSSLISLSFHLFCLLPYSMSGAYLAFTWSSAPFTAHHGIMAHHIPNRISSLPFLLLLHYFYCLMGCHPLASPFTQYYPSRKERALASVHQVSLLKDTRGVV